MPANARAIIICTYRWNSYLKHFRNFLGKTKYLITIEKIIQSGVYLYNNSTILSIIIQFEVYLFPLNR